MASSTSCTFTYITDAHIADGGPPQLVICPGWGHSAAFDHAATPPSAFLESLARPKQEGGGPLRTPARTSALLISHLL